jgi:hypothetical protein
MSDEASEGEYDLAPIPRPKHPATSPKPIGPPVLSYQRPVPLDPVQPNQDVPTPRNVLSKSEKAYHWIKAGGALLIIGVGVLVVFFISMWIGFAVVGLGAFYLMFSAPSDAEKRGYHF